MQSTGGEEPTGRGAHGEADVGAEGRAAVGRGCGQQVGRGGAKAVVGRGGARGGRGPRQDQRGVSIIHIYLYTCYTQHT